MSGNPPPHGQQFRPNGQGFTSPPNQGNARPYPQPMPVSNQGPGPMPPHQQQGRPPMSYPRPPNPNPNYRPHIPSQSQHQPNARPQSNQRPPMPQPPQNARSVPSGLNQRPGQFQQPPINRPPPQQQAYTQSNGPTPPSIDQNVHQVTEQMGGLNLNSQTIPEAKSKIRSRYANDPSLSPSSDGGATLPNYGMTSPPASYQQLPNQPQQTNQYPNTFIQPQQPQFAPKKAIDINMAPSAVEFQGLDQQEYDNEPFYTTTQGICPKASTDFCAIDNGNANPKFLRLTTRNIPVTGELQEASQIPLALVVQPLAELREDEIPVPEIDFGEEGPLRCTRCKGYINPFVTFLNGGRKYACSLCRFENDVPESYFCNLDMNGRRLDVDQRPELRVGSVEFVATKEFNIRPPAIGSIVFVVDISWGAVQNGALYQSIHSIKNLLYSENGGLGQEVRFGLITFDKNVHFYNFNASLDQAQMLVVSDSNDPFVPLSDGFLVDPIQSRHVIEPFLETLPALYGNNRVAEAALGSALTSAQLALAETGGKIFAFQSSLPTFGLGALKTRENLKAFGSEKEMALFACADSFYEKLSESCVECGVSIDLFITANTYVDIATIGFPTSKTNGEIFFYPSFDPKKHGFKFNEDLRKAATRPFGTNAVMRIRCSDGLIVDRHIGNFHMRNSADVELSCIDSEKSIVAILQHDSSKLDEKADVCFQVALLYTRSDGLRRIRVHNLSVPVTTLIGNLFKYADIDCLMNVLAKLSVKASFETPLKSVREHATEKCVKILTSYRKNCAQGTSPGQLILPEVLKLLPLYTNSLLKNKALRSGMDVSLDLRVQKLRNWSSLPISQSVLALYPRVSELHTMSPEVGKPGYNGRIVLPKLVRASYSFLSPEGSYLLENGLEAYLWIGRKVDPGFISAAFGVPSIEHIDPNMTEVPTLDNPFNEQIRSVINHLRSQRPHAMSLHIVRQQLDANEVEFCNLLVEDKNVDNPSYVDYLCLVHRQIQNEVSRV